MADKNTTTKDKVMSKGEIAKILSTCKCGKAEDFDPIVWRVETVPEAMVRDKFGRDNNLQVTRSSVDLDGKKFIYEHVVKVDEFAVREVPFEEVCKHFGWKEMKFEMNAQTIRPVWCESKADERSAK